MKVQIINNADIETSWFCYRSYDDSQMGRDGYRRSGRAGGSRSYIDPPRNSTGNYYIRFARKGELTEIAGCYSPGPAGDFVEGSGGQYKASHP